MSNNNVSKDDFEYAFESTKIIREPARFIDTFGLTRFEFLMATELMDSTGQIRVRSGVIEAQKPLIIKPQAYSELEFDGFSEESRKEASRLIEWLKNNGHNLAFLQYGFEFKKKETKEEIVHESMETVIANLEADADRVGNPALAILEGVDDTWEVSLLKFTIEMINRSRDVNLSDYRRNGLL